jgi:hypothetical protein
MEVTVGRPSDGSGGAANAGTTWIRSSARLRAGRIVEIRILRLADLDDVERLNAEVFAAIERAGPRALIYADHRFASPVPRDVADALSRGMRQANRKILQTAILLDPANTTFNLQVERIVRCACNSARRLFSGRIELHAWMDGVMTDDERRILPRLFEPRQSSGETGMDEDRSSVRT